MKRRSIRALPDKIVVRAVNSPDPHLAAEALLPLLFAVLDVGAEAVDAQSTSSGCAANRSLAPRSQLGSRKRTGSRIE